MGSPAAQGSRHGARITWRGLLIVSQTDDVQSEVETLLQQIRAGERSQPGDVIQLPD